MNKITTILLIIVSILLMVSTYRHKRTLEEYHECLLERRQELIESIKDVNEIVRLRAEVDSLKSNPLTNINP